MAYQNLQTPKAKYSLIESNIPLCAPPLRYVGFLSLHDLAAYAVHMNHVHQATINPHPDPDQDPDPDPDQDPDPGQDGWCEFLALP